MSYSQDSPVTMLLTSEQMHLDIQGGVDSAWEWNERSIQRLLRSQKAIAEGRTSIGALSGILLPYYERGITRRQAAMKSRKKRP